MTVINHTVGVFGIPSKAPVVGFEPSNNPRVPRENKGYKFRRRLVSSFVNWMNNPAGSIYMLTGPTGTGKTSFIEQAAARLHLPVYTVKGSEDFRFQEIVGGFRFISDAPGMTPYMKYVGKQFLAAKRDGGILLINEFDYCNPGEIAALNDVIDAPIEVAENGCEIVSSHPLFRIAVTGNTAGNGDQTGAYRGTQPQNIALLGRMVGARVGYPTSDEELEILQGAIPVLPRPVAEKMVEVANSIRNLFLGLSGRGTDGSLPYPMCTRVLLAWARKTVEFGNAPNPLEEGLHEALLFRSMPEEEEAILQLCRDTFGDLWASKNK